MTIENQDLPVLSVEQAMQFVGDPELFVEISEMLLEELPEQMGFVRAHWADRNLAELSKTAHRLKGNFGVVAAGRAHAAAKALEHAAKAGDNEAAADAFDDLEAAVAQVVPELERHIAASQG